MHKVILIQGPTPTLVSSGPRLRGSHVTLDLSADDALIRDCSYPRLHLMRELKSGKPLLSSKISLIITD